MQVPRLKNYMKFIKAESADKVEEVTHWKAYMHGNKAGNAYIPGSVSQTQWERQQVSTLTSFHNGKDH